MKTKMTVVVDNVSHKAMKGEWGLCILIEYGEKKILLDAGASSLFAENLGKLGFDIKEIDYGVLSHAHYDHANGIPEFFKENEKAKFYFRESTGENCYFKKFFVKKYIGIPRDILTDFKDRIEFVSGDYKLCEGVYLIPHKCGKLDKIGRREMMYCHTDSGWKPDNFSHEQSLVIETDKGLVILNSCSHGGALNIINDVRSTFPDKKIYGYIGGLHLYNKKPKEIITVANEINNAGIEFVCTGHCTERRAYGMMKEILQDKLHQLNVGLEMEF